MKKLLALPLLLLLTGCGSSDIWGWYVINPNTANGWINIKFLINGMGNTILISLVAAFISITLGLFICLPGLSERRWLRIINRIYVEFFRGTSIFVQLFWAYFVLPLLGVPLSPLQAGVLALGLNVGAYGAEVVRGAIKSIPREQYEACTALNLTRFQEMRYVILPKQSVASCRRWPTSSFIS